MSDINFAHQVQSLSSLWKWLNRFASLPDAPFVVKRYTVKVGTALNILTKEGHSDAAVVAEQIALLDVISGGRCLFGFGRSAESVEYEGFRIPMEEARPRFVEAANIIVKALTNEVFDWQGEFFTIPTISIRQRPVSLPERRFYDSSVTPESSEIMAKLGFGVLAVAK